MPEAAENHLGSKVKTRRSLFLKIHEFINDKPGVTLAFILAIIFGLLGIAGNYNVLPCQKEISAGKSWKICFGLEPFTPVSAVAGSDSQPHPQVQNPVPPPVQPSKGDAEISASDKRLTALEAAAEKWHSRTGPIHETLADLLGSITVYDQNRFDKQPEAKEALDYLQSLQKTISSEKDKIRSQDKNAIPINVDITGLGDVGDRAAKQLDDWLKSHRFNTNKNESVIYITVKGKQESHFNDYTAQKDANTSLCITAKWLDGSLFFKSKIGPVSASAGSPDEAENRSLDAAVKQMISTFNSHVN